MPQQKKVDDLEIEMRRFLRTERETISVLSVDGEHQCFVLEDAVRPAGVKVYGQTAIPAGRYRVLISYSNRFKRRLPLLLNVPMFEGIRIHPGNTAENTEGCLMPGTSWSCVSGRGFVYESRVAQAALQERIADAIAAGRSVWISIINLAEEKEAQSV